MQFGSLSFWRNFRSTNKQYVVLGLGRFGRAVCSTLHQMGYEVMGIDSGEKQVTQALNDNIVSHALQLDTTDRQALAEAGVFEFETAIVAIGNYIEASTITTLNLKDGGVNYVVAKASTEIHGQLLDKVGANLVIFPEREMGCQVARMLTRPNVLERLDLDANNSVVELVIPEEFEEKTLQELQLRSRYGVNVLAVAQQCTRGGVENIQVNPNPYDRLHKGMVLIVIGSNEGIERLPM
ncbi:MAG: potassium channel family protein [Limnothrix sp. BL-A-16]|jgi:trk system potassium uptake protein TrkA